MFVGPVAAARTLTPPATSYANAGGTGDRTASITVTSNITPDSGALNTIVNGVNSGVDGWDMPGTGATAIPNGAYFNLHFASKKYITKIKLYFRNTPSMGLWDVLLGDGTTYPVTAASFTWNTGTSQEVTLSGLQPEGYTDIKIQKNGAGANYTNDFFQEIELKLAPGAT